MMLAAQLLAVLLRHRRHVALGAAEAAVVQFELQVNCLRRKTDQGHQAEQKTVSPRPHYAPPPVFHCCVIDALFSLDDDTLRISESPGLSEADSASIQTCRCATGRALVCASWLS